MLRLLSYTKQVWQLNNAWHCWYIEYNKFHHNLLVIFDDFKQYNTPPTKYGKITILCQIELYNIWQLLRKQEYILCYQIFIRRRKYTFTSCYYKQFEIIGLFISYLKIFGNWESLRIKCMFRYLRNVIFLM